MNNYSFVARARQLSEFYSLAFRGLVFPKMAKNKGKLSMHFAGKFIRRVTSEDSPNGGGDSWTAPRDVAEAASDNSAESARSEPEGVMERRKREKEKETRGTREKSRLVKPVGKARLAARPAGTSLSSPLCSE